MAEEKTERNGDLPPTLKQSELAKALIAEINMEELDIPPAFSTGTMTRKEMGVWIEHLTAFKRELETDLPTPRRMVPFNDAAFGMIYKLLWNFYSHEPLVTKPTGDGLVEIAKAEYVLYRKVRDAVKAHAENSGK